MSQDLIKQKLAEAAAKNQTAGNDTSDKLRQAALAAEQAGNAELPNHVGGQGQDSTGGGSQAKPVTFNQADIQRKVQAFTQDAIQSRLNNSKAEVVKLLAKQPNRVGVILQRDGENKTYKVDETLLSKVDGLTADAEFPLKKPQKLRATIDGYSVRKPDPSGTLGAPEPMTKRQLGDWIKDYALVRIGTEERGARITEKKVLNSELPYSLSVWGLDASKSEDIEETYQVDNTADPQNSKFYLETGSNKFRDSNGQEVKIYTMLPFPRYERKPEYVSVLGPIRMNRKAPPQSQFEIEDTLKTLAKIAYIEDLKGQTKAD